MPESSIALALGTTHSRLHGAPNTALGGELLADDALLVEGTADRLRGSAEDAGLWIVNSLLVHPKPPLCLPSPPPHQPYTECIAGGLNPHR